MYPLIPKPSNSVARHLEDLKKLFIFVVCVLTVCFFDIEIYLHHFSLLVPRDGGGR